MNFINYIHAYEASDRDVKSAIESADSAIKLAYPEGVYMSCNHGVKRGKWYLVQVVSAGYDYAYHGHVFVKNAVTGKVKRVSPHSLKM